MPSLSSPTLLHQLEQLILSQYPPNHTIRDLNHNLLRSLRHGGSTSTSPTPSNISPEQGRNLEQVPIPTSVRPSSTSDDSLESNRSLDNYSADDFLGELALPVFTPPSPSPSYVRATPVPPIRYRSNPLEEMTFGGPPLKKKAPRPLWDFPSWLNMWKSISLEHEKRVYLRS